MRGIKARTIRFPAKLSDQGVELADRMGVSFNELVVDSLAERLKEEEDRELGRQFDLLGQHPEMCDVEWMLPAAMEVLEKDDA